MTKTKQIKEHLDKFGQITEQDAFDLYEADRIQAIIHSFRKKGDIIETRIINGSNHFKGLKITYHLIKE